MACILEKVVTVIHCGSETMWVLIQLRTVSRESYPLVWLKYKQFPQKKVHPTILRTEGADRLKHKQNWKEKKKVHTKLMEFSRCLQVGLIIKNYQNLATVVKNRAYFDEI